MPKDVAEKLGKNFGNAPVGSGPFKFVEWIPGDHITLERNPAYWMVKPSLERLIFKPIPDKSVATMALATGELDIIEDIPGPNLAMLGKNKDVVIDNVPGVNYFFVGFKMFGPPFDQKAFREAVYSAVDMDGAIKAIFKEGTGIRAYSAIPPGLWPDDREYLTKHAVRKDPTKARKLFDQLIAEGKMVRDFPVIIRVNQDPIRVKLGEIMVTELKSIGVNASLEVMEWGAYINALKGQSQFMYMLGTTPAILDPDAVLNWLFSSDSNHGKFLNLTNKRIDELLLTGRKSATRAERDKVYLEAQRIALGEIYHIPAYHSNFVQGYRKRVHDFHASPFWRWDIVTPFANVWVDPK